MDSDSEEAFDFPVSSPEYVPSDIDSDSSEYEGKEK